MHKPESDYIFGGKYPLSILNKLILFGRKCEIQFHFTGN